MSFLYLDMLSNLLLEDAKEIGKEFDIKMNFIRQQERNCLENAKQVRDQTLVLHEDIASLITVCSSFPSISL